MSPAKRKTARPARRTSGSGSKPRRSSAPLAASKRKTPAKAKSHRVNGGAGTGCDLQREELERLLDREGDRAGLFTHVPGCSPCTTALTVVASQRDALQRLTVEPKGTAVEFLLIRGREAGDRKLADLVYELAKACLVVVKDIDRRVHLETRPRQADAIGREVRGVGRRMSGTIRTDVAGRLPLDGADESNALVAADSCIRILEQVEGATERQRLAKAVSLICSELPKDAEDLLSKILRTSNSAATQLHAFRNLLWAMIRQEKYAQILALEEQVIARYPRDWECTFNLVVAAANSGNHEAFTRTTAVLRRIESQSPATSSFRKAVIAFESQRLADPLGWSLDRVSGALGGRSKSATADTAR